MAKKKHTSLPVSQEDNKQAQQIVERYHQVADNLHASANQSEAEDALAEIDSMPEAAQIALLKLLAKERHTDAADVLLAVNELSPVKDVRKEARRSLIQLEGARIYPEWKPPVDRTPAIGQLEVSSNPPRFWKGIVTDSLAIGEAQLNLFFEQGDDYQDVRIFGFLLEFTHEGVKDFFTRVQSKRSVEKFIQQITSEMSEVKTKSCSLAEGRRLIMDAIAVNQRIGTQPYKDFRFNISLINQLILEADDLDEEDDFDEDIEEFDGDEEEDLDVEDEVDLHGLTPEQVVTTFIESWVDGEFDTAYMLLSGDSPLREGLEMDDWIERRDAWADEAIPGELEPNFIRERESQKSKLWLPTSISAERSNTRKEIEVGWSIELDETELSNTLPELPRATVVYEQTGRQWFWTSYTLVQEEEDWRIQNMVDEGTSAEELPVDELRRRITELEKFLDKFAQENKLKTEQLQELTEQETLGYLEEVLWRVMHTIYYSDVLIKKSPLDLVAYEAGASRTLMMQQYERCSVYVRGMIEHFTEARAENLRVLASIQRLLSQKYYEEQDEERAEECVETAKEALRESLAIEDTYEAHMSLAEFLIEPDEEYDEAEDQLLQAKALATKPDEEAHISLHLGEIAMEREQYDQAVFHYQRVLDHEPNAAESWIDLADAYEALENYEEAEASYRRAIALEPANEDLYYDLSKMYTKMNEPAKAIAAIEEGISNNPESAVLNVYLASNYMESGDYTQAEVFLDRAERIDPSLEVVKMFRQVLNVTRPKSQPKFRSTPGIPKLSRPKKKRK